MLIKLLPSPKWDKSLKMKPLQGKDKWWKRCSNITRCSPKRREIENQTGSMINKLKMLLRSIEPIWVISCKRISKLLNHSLLHTDSYHITSRASEKNKSKILSLKEINKSLMLSMHKKIWTLKNMLGQSKIYLILNINWITKSSSKIGRN